MKGTQYVVSTPGFISFAVYISPDGTWTNFIIMIAVMVIVTVTAFLVSYILGKKAESRA